MSTGNKQVAFNLEKQLNELNLTPTQRADAIGAMRVAADAVEILDFLRAGVKRVAEFISLKPSVRA